MRLSDLAHLGRQRLVDVSELLLQLREQDRVGWVLTREHSWVSLQGSVKEGLPLVALEAGRLRRGRSRVLSWYERLELLALLGGTGSLRLRIG